MPDELDDFVNASAEWLKYQFSVVLVPDDLMGSDDVSQPLAWQSIPYGREEIHKVPDDKRGIYAFAIKHRSAVLPPHAYVLYIGIAGHNSWRSLRARYSDYLNRRSLLKRARIARMVGCWSPVLRFFFAPVEEHVTPCSGPHRGDGCTRSRSVAGGLGRDHDGAAGRARALYLVRATGPGPVRPGRIDGST